MLLCAHNRWSDELLRLFLFSRNVAIAESSAHDHQALVALVQASANLPIVPAQGTPASIFDLLTLQQLNFYLKQKRGHPVNSNSAWLRFAPPKQGRNKRDALRAFALKEYARDISGKQSELDRFDVDIADTLRQPHTIHQVRTELTDGDDERFGVMGAYLLDDDIE